MDAQIVLPLITGSGLHMAEKNLSTHRQFQTRSDAIPIALGSHGPDEKCIIAIAAVVAEQIGRLAIVPDHDIQIAIIVQIANDERTADFLQSESRSGRRPDV